MINYITNKCDIFREIEGKNENVILADGVHELIITQELWDRMQVIQKPKAEKPMKNYEGNHH